MTLNISKNTTKCCQGSLNFLSFKKLQCKPKVKIVPIKLVNYLTEGVPHTKMKSLNIYRRLIPNLAAREHREHMAKQTSKPYQML